MKKFAVTLMMLLSTLSINAKQPCAPKAPSIMAFVEEHAAELAKYVKRSKKIETQVPTKLNPMPKKPKETKAPELTDEELAFTTVKEAASEGYVPAQDLLAYCYATGTGTKPNGKLAFSWYLSAALGGSPSAKASLIACFDQGIGVVKDTVMAQVLRTLLA